MKAIVSHFHVLRKIGEGGMGEVYEAEDIHLKRRVALKFISERQSQSEHHRIRLVREAQAAASLNHPNVCTIHEVGLTPDSENIQLDSGQSIQGGTPFIAMELLSGSTLADLRKTRPLKILEVLRIAVDVAEALAVAHDRGIIHRDIKPANIFITSQDQVKVLDFGLARIADEPTEEDASTAPTHSSPIHLTEAGHVLGTVSYSSPEQLTGKRVDARSDVFSFGATIYEIVSGSLPFRGGTPTSTIARILESEPTPLVQLRSDVPPGLTRIISRCLNKKPSQRYNHTVDLVIDLRELLQEAESARLKNNQENPIAGRTGTAEEPTTNKNWRSRIPWRSPTVLSILAFASIAPGLGIGLLIQSTKTLSPDLEYHRLTYSGKAGLAALSPDADFVAFSQETGSRRVEVLIADLAGGAPLTILEGSEVQTLTWSPDGTNLLVSWIDNQPSGTVDAGTSIWPRFGGTPTWLPFSPLADWSPNGRTIANVDMLANEISFLNIENRGNQEAAPRQAVSLPSSLTSVRTIDWFPAEFILVLATDDNSHSVLLAISPMSGHIDEVLKTSSRILSAHWSEHGRTILYLMEAGERQELRRLAINPKSGLPAGVPLTLMSGLEADDFSVPASGDTVLLRNTDISAHLFMAEIERDALTDASRYLQLTSGNQIDSAARFSPDGRFVVFSRGGLGQTSNMFSIAIGEHDPTQLTYLDCSIASSDWSPDGETIAFSAECGRPRELWLASLSGRPSKPLVAENIGDHLAWTPNGSIVFESSDNRQLLLHTPSSGESMPLTHVDDQTWYFGPQVSPNAREVAVACNRPRNRGLWVLSLDDGEERPLHLNWVKPLRWSQDGKWIYGTRDQRYLYRIDAEHGTAENILSIPFENAEIEDISPDGNRVVFSRRESVSDLWLVRPTVAQ